MGRAGSAGNRRECSAQEVPNGLRGGHRDQPQISEPQLHAKPARKVHTASNNPVQLLTCWFLTLDSDQQAGET